MIPPPKSLQLYQVNHLKAVARADSYLLILADSCRRRERREISAAMGRRTSKEGLNKGPWTAIEDKVLTDYIMVHGEGKWGNIPKRASLNRCGKSCRLRWLNYLRPDIKRGNISPDEEDLIIRLHKLLGNRWSLIAGRLPGRTDNEIKNYWNTYLSRRSAQGRKSSIRKTQKKPISSKVAQTVHPTDHQLSFTITSNQKNPDDQHHHTSNIGFAPLSWVQHSTTKQDEITSVFAKDFSVGDMSISDFLDLDFAHFRDFDAYDMNNVRELDGGRSTSGYKADVPICADQAFVGPGWSGSNCVQDNVPDSNLGSLTSFMDSNNGWII
ncbi:hypothetical protein K2173_017537 [Erythroxylum novogranatense]|uniref:Myb-related protein 123 n=1 Tax=Erythroxylum novogranatense TaxID=1862640 RepID=A0AAV8TNQ0_9ROSI|nr:hypothetical protein K2173_017537 [Erythroxylum novogranatense]